MTYSRSDKIKRILERKSNTYAEFLSATLLLKKALEAEEMAAVDRLIEQRAMLIGVVDGLDREVACCQQTGPYDQPRETVRKTAAISADLGEKLRQILCTNQDCRAIASDRLSVFSKELLDLHKKEEGINGYTRHAERVPKFLNVRT